MLQRYHIRGSINHVIRNPKLNSYPKSSFISTNSTLDKERDIQSQKRKIDGSHLFNETNAL